MDERVDLTERMIFVQEKWRMELEGTCHRCGSHAVIPPDTLCSNCNKVLDNDDSIEFMKLLFKGRE